MDLEAGYQASISQDSGITDLGTIGLSDKPKIDLEAGYQATNPTGLNAASGQIGKGLTLGFFDEIQGAEAGTQNYLKNLFGQNTGKDFSQAYSDKVKDLRGVDSAYQTANPKTAIGLQMLGALAPALVTGGASALTEGGLKAAGTLGTAAKSLYGVGIEEAPSILQLAKMGAVQGAVTGAGEANDGNRLLGAGIGGGVGAVAAPILGKTIEKSLNGVTDYLASKGIIGVPGLASTGAERGSISNLPGGVSYSPEELYVAQQLKNTPLEQITGGQRELSSALDNGAPLFLPDAVQSADITRNAKFIANNKDSMGFAQNAISSRREGAGNRIETLLSDFSPHVDPTDAGTTLMSSSQKAVSALEKVRRDATSPLYKALEGQKVPDEVAIGLLDDPVIEDSINAVGRVPAYRKEIGTAAPESFKYLQLVKEHLNDQVNSLVRAGNKNEARIVSQSRDKVVNALEQLDQYKAANSLYRKLSEPISKLTGTKDEAGLLEGILNTDRINAHKAPAELLKRTPAQILEIKATLGEKGQEELSKSARSLMQDILAKADENNQPALKLLNNNDNQNKFMAMMGEDAYQKFSTSLDLEKRMARANNLYAAGSPTHGYFQEENAFEKSAGLLSKLNPANWKETLSSLFSKDMPADLAQKVAKIYFDPKSGYDSLQKIMPLLQQYAANKSFSEAAGKGASVIGSRAEELLKPPSNQGTGFELPINKDPVKRSEFDAAIKPKDGPEPKLTPIPSQLNNLSKGERIKKVADFVNEQPPLIQAIIKGESSGDPFSQSPTGPKGLMQISAKIAKAYGAKDAYDPRQNVKAGTAFLQDLSTKYEDPKVILAAYQAGESVINDAIKKAGLTRKSADWDSIKEFVPTINKEGKPKLWYPDYILKHLDNITEI